ncbi:hypothetical protein D2V08_01485 [Flagellimonas lutimaris]|uniref:Uncharacterized protein n=1 Tax=Flagellimonas lutimaris TaxID=475082 RepID=A0A3A1NBR7_9FLAO|nr:hypothetical protein D2V08_01485 [Allomuricauda lutimaris]
MLLLLIIKFYTIMEFNINPFAATILSIFFTCCTFMAIGWFLLLNGIVILICLILQLVLIWKLHMMEGLAKIYLFATLISFIILCLFREDFGDTSNSAISPLSIISKLIGLRDSARYHEVSIFGSVVNFLWFGQLIGQIAGLIKFR